MDYIPAGEALREIARMLGGRADAITMLIDWLRAGDIRAYAEEYGPDVGNGRVGKSLRLQDVGVERKWILPSFWRSDDPNEKEHWSWQEGSFTTTTDGDILSLCYGRTVARRVHFNAAGIAEMIANEAPSEGRRPPLRLVRNEVADTSIVEPVTARASKPVPEPKLRAWFEGFSKMHDVDVMSVDEEILSAARLAFPENLVARERVREMVGARKRGPKPIR